MPFFCTQYTVYGRSVYICLCKVHEKSFNFNIVTYFNPKNNFNYSIKEFLKVKTTKFWCAFFLDFLFFLIWTNMIVFRSAGLSTKQRRVPSATFPRWSMVMAKKVFIIIINIYYYYVCYCLFFVSLMREGTEGNQSGSAWSTFILHLTSFCVMAQVCAPPAAARSAAPCAAAGAHITHGLMSW